MNMTTTLFTNARLIDPGAGTDAPGWLLVEGGAIRATGREAATPEADERAVHKDALRAEDDPDRAPGRLSAT